MLLARQSAAITLQFILCGAVRTSADESKASERSKFVNVSQMRTAGGEGAVSGGGSIQVSHIERGKKEKN